jgi:hypothetical protein
MHTESFGAKFPESNFPSSAPAAPLVTVWSMVSLLVHLTMSFAAIDTPFGWKRKFDIVTDVTVDVGHVTILTLSDETVVVLGLL